MKLLLAIYQIGVVIFFCSPLIALLFVNETGENLPTGNGVSATHGRCSNCDAGGRLQCRKCFGAGWIDWKECRKCDGRGSIVDPVCSGKGFIE